MIVVSDTSPLTALLTVGAADILPELFKEVIIPRAVGEELRRSHAELPPWLRVAVVKDQAQARQYALVVDAGEADAIELARELHANQLLMDERKGRRLAAREGVPVIRLLGVVLLARRNRTIPSARALIERLQQEAGMYLAEDIKEAALNSVGE